MTVAATLRALGINLWMSTTDVRRCYHPSCVVILLMTAADKSLLRGFADLKSALSAICRLEVGVVGRLSADCRQNCRLEVGIWRRPEAYSVIYGGIGIFLIELTLNDPVTSRLPGYLPGCCPHLIDARSSMKVPRESCLVHQLNTSK